MDTDDKMLVVSGKAHGEKHIVVNLFMVPRCGYFDTTKQELINKMVQLMVSRFKRSESTIINYMNNSEEFTYVVENIGSVDENILFRTNKLDELLCFLCPHEKEYYKQNKRAMAHFMKKEETVYDGIRNKRDKIISEAEANYQKEYTKIKSQREAYRERIEQRLKLYREKKAASDKKDEVTSSDDSEREYGE